ncbi:MAG: DUF559 domain-containing protein [Deltaproteobacteria bacterium]|nr:DUF559 domain-containing protein [Deltaproteobacteria bacterium]
MLCVALAQGRGRRSRADPCQVAERKHLRARRFSGFKFRRQHRIGPYFVDLGCVAQRLIIEIGGSQHAEPAEETKDAARTAYLNQRGYRVIRFWNEQIKCEMDDVLETIYLALDDY